MAEQRLDGLGLVTPLCGRGEQDVIAEPLGLRVDWDTFFGTLRQLNFDGVATSCVFAWEERARESSAFMLNRIRKELTA